MKQVSEISKTAAMLIGFYYLHRNNGNYKDAEDIIDLLHFTDISVKGDTLTIELRRVGLFIGRRGSNYDSFFKFINEELPAVKKIKLVENVIVGYAYPLNPAEEEYYEKS